MHLNWTGAAGEHHGCAEKGDEEMFWHISLPEEESHEDGHEEGKVSLSSLGTSGIWLQMWGYLRLF